MRSDVQNQINNPELNKVRDEFCLDRISTDEVRSVL